MVKSNWLLDCSAKTQFYVLTTVMLCANTNEKGWTRELTAALVRQRSPSQHTVHRSRTNSSTSPDISTKESTGSFMSKWDTQEIRLVGNLSHVIKKAVKWQCACRKTPLGGGWRYKSLTWLHNVMKLCLADCGCGAM